MKITKKALELAEEYEIDPKGVKGTGKDGRILSTDVQAVIDETEAEDVEEELEITDDDDEDSEETESDDDGWGEEEPEGQISFPTPGKRTSTTRNDKIEPPEEEKPEASQKVEAPKEKHPEPETLPEPVKTVPIYFEWLSVEPDAVQYKPMKPVLQPLNITIQVDLPEKYVVEERGMGDNVSMLIITPEGMGYAAGVLSKATQGNAPSGSVGDTSDEPEGWEEGEDSFDDWADEENLDNAEDW